MIGVEVLLSSIEKAMQVAMKRYKLTIAYDGTAYCGWQRQVDPTPTVQRVIEKAAGEIVNHYGHYQRFLRAQIHGVHAMGQVAAAEPRHYA